MRNIRRELTRVAARMPRMNEGKKAPPDPDTPPSVASIAVPSLRGLIFGMGRCHSGNI